MRIVRYYQHGGPEVLKVEQSAPPEPGPGQVRLLSEVIGASFVDTTLRAGTHPFAPGVLPGNPHGEVVGIVDAVGPGVDNTMLGPVSPPWP
jgi:NADPH2:quinone reductase